MMTRENIERIPKLNKKILRYEDHLIYLKEKAKTLPTLSQEEKVKSSKRIDSMKYTDAAIDLELELTEMKAELTELTEEAKQWIETLDTPLERRIFTMRLIKCFTWDEVAELVGFSMRRMFEITKRTLDDKAN